MWLFRPENMKNCVDKANLKLDSHLCIIAENKLRSETFMDSFYVYNEDFSNGVPLCANYDGDFYSYWCDFGASSDEKQYNDYSNCISNYNSYENGSSYYSYVFYNHAYEN